MKISAIANLHGILPLSVEIPKADVLVIAGGILPFDSKRDSVEELIYQSLFFSCEFIPWLTSQSKRFGRIIGTWGFTDTLVYRQRYTNLPYILNGMCLTKLGELKNVKFGIDEAITYKGVTFWCSPWSVEQHNHAFAVNEENSANHWSRIPYDTDVLITHEAPKLHIINSSIGSRVLESKVSTLKNLKHHIYGHSHTHHNITRIGHRSSCVSYTDIKTQTNGPSFYSRNNLPIQQFEIK